MKPSERRTLWLNGLRELGKLHDRTRDKAELERFSKARAGRSDFAASVDYWEAHYLASSETNPLQLMVDIAAWMRAHEPIEARRAVCWGDSRIGNALFDDEGQCVGFVDWELFSIGDPIRDLAYWLYTDEHFVYAGGRALEAWPTSAESIAAYEEGARFSVNAGDLAFYRIYQGYHIVCTLSRLIQIKKSAGQLPAQLQVDAQFTPVAFLKKEWVKLL
jgi:aminoglycoside phosphotransferase (APT) family kinase protein